MELATSGALLLSQNHSLVVRVFPFHKRYKISTINRKCSSLAYDTLLQYSLPFIMAVLGMVLAAAGRALRADHFVNWIACGYLLTGFSFGLQSFFTNSNLALAAPLTTVLYLAGAAAMTQGTALRCGDGWHRKATVWAIGTICFVNAARLGYFDDNLVMRLMSLNVSLGLIHLSQLPYLIRLWKGLSNLDRLLGFTSVQLGLFHFLHAGYAAQETLYNSEPQAIVQNLTQTAHWQMLMASAVILSIWFGCLTLSCAAKDRFGPELVRH